MINQLFEKRDYYHDLLSSKIEDYAPAMKYDIFGVDTIDSFFEINGFVPTYYISYTVLDKTTNNIRSMHEHGKCYMRVFHNKKMFRDIIVAVYEHKVCIIAKELATHSFVMPINITHDSLVDYAISTCGYEKSDQEALYEIMLNCMDNYLSYNDNQEEETPDKEEDNQNT